MHTLIRVPIESSGKLVAVGDTSSIIDVETSDDGAIPILLILEDEETEQEDMVQIVLVRPSDSITVDETFKYIGKCYVNADIVLVFSTQRIDHVSANTLRVQGDSVQCNSD